MYFDNFSGKYGGIFGLQLSGQFGDPDYWGPDYWDPDYRGTTVSVILICLSPGFESYSYA
jgi:hypothetical protein